MQPVNRSEEQLEVLTVFRRVLGQELHNLSEWPEILWQQMYNRLQWVDDEGGKRPVSQVITLEFQKRTSPGTKPWLHLKSRLRESSALLLVLEGHTDWVLSCAFSPGGKTLASASQDNTVRLWVAETGESIGVYPCLGYVRSCDFSPLNNMIACGDPGGNLYILELISFSARKRGSTFSIAG
jgi:WD40 repeat protein